MQSGGDGSDLVRIFVADMPNGEPRAIGGDRGQLWPSAYGDWVAWEDYRNALGPGPATNADVFAFNLKEGKEYAIATASAYRETRPVVLPDGICWNDMRNGYLYGPGYVYNEDIYCRRFVDMKEVALDTSPLNQAYPVRLDWGIAWMSEVADLDFRLRTAPGIPTSP